MRRKHHDLLAWQQAIELVKAVYAFTEKLPKSEQYGLVSQMRRAAISIPSNIAEGTARETKREFMQFLVVARGSLSELETQLHICGELGFGKVSPEFAALVDKVFGLIGGLLRSAPKESRDD